MTGLAAEDRMAISDLFVGFCHAVDGLGDGEAPAALFAEDAVYDLTGFGMQAFTGRAAIRDFFSASFSATERNVHFISNILVHSGDATGAFVTAYVHAFSHTSDGGKLELRAVYDADVRKTGEGWKFARMGISMLPV